MFEAQRADDEEAAASLAQLDTARRDSFITLEAANVADGAKAELVQDALRAAQAAEEEASARATAAAIAAQLAADDAECLRRAAVKEAEEAEDSAVACGVCLEERELTQLNCNTQRSSKCKLCNTCFNRCAGKCPFCRGECRR